MVTLFGPSIPNFDFPVWATLHNPFVGDLEAWVLLVPFSRHGIAPIAHVGPTKLPNLLQTLQRKPKGEESSRIEVVDFITLSHVSVFLHSSWE